MAYITALANQKGGVGKTTSAVNLAAAVADLGYRVLMIDSDPQGNTTSGVGVSKKNAPHSLYDAMSGSCALRDAIVQTPFRNLSVVPATIALAAAEFELYDVEHREDTLKSLLATVADDFDYIFIVCPPSLGLLTINALTAANGVIIPMQCEYFALEGLSQLMMTIRRIKQLYNEKLEINGILITMYNGRLNLSAQVIAELKKYYADKLFSSTVARNVRLSEAPSFGMPIQYFDRHSKGADAYRAVAKEYLSRVGVCVK